MATKEKGGIAFLALILIILVAQCLSDIRTNDVRPSLRSASAPVVEEARDRALRRLTLPSLDFKTVDMKESLAGGALQASTDDSLLPYQNILHDGGSIPNSKPAPILSLPDQPPPPPHDENANYSWVGNHWDPPRGVPRYSPRQMRETFARFDVLWFGDSNARQDMYTLRNLIEAPDPADVTVAALERGINSNKAGRHDEACGVRDFANGTVLGKYWHPYSFFCWQIGDGDHSTNIDLANHSSSPQSLKVTMPSKGKFDFAGADCTGQLRDLVNAELNGTLASLVSGYDWLVVDFGIHEVVRNLACQLGMPAGESTELRVERTLDLLARLASPGFRVAWKTTGTVEGMGAQRLTLDALNRGVRGWFARSAPPHMRLVDWAAQMEPRADDKQRIKGDLKPHWGWAARLMTAQMVTHEVVTGATSEPRG